MHLLNCPCCNSIDIYTECNSSIFRGQDYSDRYPDHVAKQNYGYRVSCNNCGLHTCWWHYRVEAFDAWNKRPSDNDKENQE